MTGNVAFVRNARRSRIAPLLVAAAVCVVLGGCASGRKALPEPRVRDGATLRTEAAERPADAEPYYQLALLHCSAGAPDSALAALGGALRRDGSHAPSLALLAKLLHDAGRSAEGVRFFERRHVESLSEPVRIDVALLYADVGNTVKARKLLQGIGAGAYAQAAVVDLAYLDLVDEQNAEALASLEAQATRFPDSPEVACNLALARLRAGDVEGGARLLRATASKHPDFAPAQLNLALVLRHYLFDVESAERAEQHVDALGTPVLSDAAVHRLSDIEDAAPPVPARTAGSGAQPAAAPDDPKEKP